MWINLFKHLHPVAPLFHLLSVALSTFFNSRSQKLREVCILDMHSIRINLLDVNYKKLLCAFATSLSSTLASDFTANGCKLWLIYNHYNYIVRK